MRRLLFVAALLAAVVMLTAAAAATEPPLADSWRAVRQGEAGTVNNVPDPLRGRLIQAEGEVWRRLHNGWLVPGDGIALIAVAVA
ncbi:MAG TPA: hypothetical protein HPQ04_00235, partial [Rhodospirillaceae bacterium]|nr:hypothetical protein [Rhodospirillaceae bacterium]